MARRVTITISDELNKKVCTLQAKMIRNDKHGSFISYSSVLAIVLTMGFRRV